MTKIFHISQKKLKRRYNKRIFILNLLPIVVILTLLAVVLLNRPYSNPIIYYYTVLGILTVTIGYSFITVLIGSIISTKRLKYNRLHTFVEIQNKNLIVSRYGCTTNIAGKTIAYQKMWVVNLAEIEEIYFSNKDIVIVAPARFFYEQSDWLTYTSDREGIRFDNWWYDTNGAKMVNGVRIKNMFSSTSRIARTIQNVSGIMQKRYAERKKFHQKMLTIANRQR